MYANVDTAAHDARVAADTMPAGRSDSDSGKATEGDACGVELLLEQQP